MQADQRQRRAYSRILRRHSPRPPVLINTLLAFVVGGSFCAGAQIFMNFFLRRGVPDERAGALTAIAVIFVGAALTALGLYDEIGRIAGMGASLPISGFANAMVSPAMEYRREGWVLGVGARVFSVAGPVIVYGVLTAILAGAVYVVFHLPLPHGA
jgi:stage V sporulation protein AC